SVALDLRILDLSSDFVDASRDPWTLDLQDRGRGGAGVSDHLRQAAGQDSVPAHVASGELQRLIGHCRLEPGPDQTQDEESGERTQGHGLRTSFSWAGSLA